MAFRAAARYCCAMIAGRTENVLLQQQMSDVEPVDRLYIIVCCCITILFIFNAFNFGSFFFFGRNHHVIGDFWGFFAIPEVHTVSCRTGGNNMTHTPSPIKANNDPQSRLSDNNSLLVEMGGGLPFDTDTAANKEMIESMFIVANIEASLNEGTTRHC